MEKKKKRLGKGLAALIGNTEIGLEEENQVISKTEIHNQVLKVKIKDILPNPDQPRQHFDEVKLKELANSLESVGMIEPIVLLNQGKEKYSLVAGERRWRASKLAGFEEIPAIVKNDVSENLLEVMLIENIQREDLSPIEEATSLNLILKQKNITHDVLAKTLGKSRSHITNTIRLLKLPSFLKEAVVQRKVSMGQAKVLIGLKEKDQKNLFQKIVKQNLSVRDVEKIAGNLSPKKIVKAKSIQKQDPHLLSIQEKLRDKFQTKVKVIDIKNKVGKIELEFYNYEGLEGILEKLRIKS